MAGGNSVGCLYILYISSVAKDLNAEQPRTNPASGLRAETARL